MEYLDVRAPWVAAGYLLVVLVSMVMGQEDVVPDGGEPPHNLAFFNQTLSSIAILQNTVLNVQEHIAFSFRTCSQGQLLYQEGGSGDFIEINLTQSGSLQLSWRRAGTQDSVVIGNDTLRNNQWYTVDSLFLQGVITLKIEQGDLTKYQEIVSNSTYRRNLWNLDLTGGNPVRVGDGFTGCIQEGPSLELSRPNTIATNVQWGVCPLETMTIEGCDVTPNPCWWYPCKNGGSCRNTGDTYTCDCPPPYTGQNCEDDRGEQACELAPCKNNGTCETRETGSRTYQCRCLPGFTGVHCEIDIDECAPQPCQNGGRCLDEVNHFTCDCSGTGYKGDICTENINECMESPPCLEGALCMDTPGSYKCKCPRGFAGRNCELSVDECESSPCQNGGTCRDDVGSYSCTCLDGYTGVNCEVDIDECVDVSCADPLMMCVDGISLYTCQCKPGYYDPTGAVDGNAVGCEDIDECASLPCFNGATCVNEENRFTCQCALGFEGDTCEIDTDECLSQPCLNGATCRDAVSGYTCDCVPGFTDTTCSRNINECHSSPCQQGGRCQDLVNGYECRCTAGWGGRHCEEEIDECASNPCQNGANCKDLIASYACICVLGFRGSNCEINVDDCVPDSCQNGGSCVDLVNDYSCECPPTWMGKNCTEVYDACAFQPCENGATCETTKPNRDFRCSCAAGFTGLQCEINIDDCVGNPCKTYQVCVDGINAYFCECPVGYEGELCEVEVDECASNPCMNGGMCNDQVGNYTCSCVGSILNLTEYTQDPNMIYWSGWTGNNCETDVDECAYSPGVCLNEGQCQNDDGTFKCLCPQSPIYYIGPYCNTVRNFCQVVDLPDLPPCHNGGECLSSDRSFTCNCSAGFTGSRCKTNIDECESSPCQYNGTCYDGVNSYICDCLPGLTGSDCEINIDECESNPCNNGGNCLDLINGYVCNCSDTGFKGDHCEINIDDCEFQPCMHGGNCTDLIKDYHCGCFLGYTGKSCEIDVDECYSSPCQNGAACEQLSLSLGDDPDYSLAAGYNCSCLPGFTGEHCEVDIDECESNPCVFGECEDGANSYVCLCQPGYTGTHCESDIDECKEYWPCKHGGTCLNQEPGYFCTCPKVFQGIQYKGKNCTVHLIGCIDNECENNSTCIPFLVSEELNQHDYVCDCKAGYTGRHCGIATSASFIGNSSLRYDAAAKANLNLKFGFRTTLPYGILASNMEAGALSNLVHLYLNDSNTISLFYQTGALSKSLHLTAPNFDLLNDADWHIVEILIERTLMTLTLYHGDCHLGSCSVSEVIDQDLSHLVGNTWFGSSPPGVSFDEGDPRSESFVGCIQDIQFNYGDFIRPRDFIGSSATENVEEGCYRQEQCDPDPCSDHGICVDLWHEFQCLCRRPYLGPQCNVSFIAATFGHENRKSYVRFAIPEGQKSELENRMELSLFLRTRAPNGLIFYLGSNLGSNFENYHDNSSFILGNLADGQLQVHVKLGSVVETFDMPVRYRLDDGEKHFLSITRIGNSVLVEVDEFSRNVYIINVFPLDAQIIAFGSLTGLSRRRRQAEPVANNTEDGFPVSTPDFLGTIQDIRLNGFSLPLYNMNRDDLEQPPAYPDPEVSEGLLEGEVSGNACASLPCQNAAMCESIFFNDFECTCPAGYQGKDCSLPEFCLSNQCPDGYECQDLADGYECVSNATFGVKSYISYRHTMTRDPVFEISFKVRTRSATGIIFHLQGQGQYAGNYVSVFVNRGLLQVKLNIGDETTLPRDPQRVEIANADWWDVAMIFDRQSDSVDFSVSSDSGLIKYRFVNSVLMTMTLAELLQSSQDVYVGGASNSYINANPSMFPVTSSIKGCLGEVRVGGVLLPFHDRSAAQNNNAAEQFYVETRVDISNDCNADPVCLTDQCQNGARCIDIWNAFICDCVPGFDGTQCENNIDDCIINDCENGATCVDGVTNFTCACVPGFTGDKCQTNINECESSPCQNNATCDDILNEYKCYCAANYTGANCEVLITDNCDSEPCQNNATCVPINATEPGEASFHCSCLPGFTGKYCDTEIDYCEGNTCQNRATCQSRRDLLDYVCTCVEGFTGDNCETNIDECESDPCQNGATCQDEINGYECVCLSGYEGIHCEDDIDECNVTGDGMGDCVNGTCVNMPGGFFCNCSDTGYEGDFCENDVDECLDEEICQNEGTCTNLPGSFWCNCTFGYEGHNCEIANCSYNPCHHGGTCTVVAGEWKCNCIEFFEGEQCGFRGPCVDVPCRNNGICHQDGSNYTCECLEGWGGDNCVDDIDECETLAPCDNGATCDNSPGSYNCTCLAGFTGTHCGTDVDECASDPCENGGVCIDDIDGFTCDCSGTGYTGPTCSEDIDECNVTDSEDHPCHGNGDCKNLPGNYTCDCYPGYTGLDCYFKNPCNDTTICNRGNCSYVIEDNDIDFVCTCHESWGGRQCDVQLEDPQRQPLKASDPIPLIVGLCVTAVVLVIVIVIVIFLIQMKKKRATRGTYSPSRQEMSGTRVELDMKPPPEERLI